VNHAVFGIAFVTEENSISNIRTVVSVRNVPVLLAVPEVFIWRSFSAHSFAQVLLQMSSGFGLV
jgi:hypothetical protein